MWTLKEKTVLMLYVYWDKEQCFLHMCWIRTKINIHYKYHITHFLKCVHMRQTNQQFYFIDLIIYSSIFTTYSFNFLSYLLVYYFVYICSFVCLFIYLLISNIRDTFGLCHCM